MGIERKRPLMFRPLQKSVDFIFSYVHIKACLATDSLTGLQCILSHYYRNMQCQDNSF